MLLDQVLGVGAACSGSEGDVCWCDGVGHDGQLDLWFDLCRVARWWEKQANCWWTYPLDPACSALWLYLIVRRVVACW